MLVPKAATVEATTYLPVAPLIEPDVVMAPFAHEVLSRLASDGQPIVLIMDQS
jgi:hypothetical protein